jgi:hypothetical protein
MISLPSERSWLAKAETARVGEGFTLCIRFESDIFNAVSIKNSANYFED